MFKINYSSENITGSEDRTSDIQSDVPSQFSGDGTRDFLYTNTKVHREDLIKFKKAISMNT